jgi:FHS family L-fucose permease-like MFS transporter
MSIIGGGLIPPAMGKISDASNIQRAFIVPLICYLYVIYFAVRGYRTNRVSAVPESAPILEAK